MNKADNLSRQNNTDETPRADVVIAADLFSQLPEEMQETILQIMRSIVKQE